MESLTRYGLYQQCRLQSVGSHWNQTIGKYLACTKIIQVNVQDLGCALELVSKELNHLAAILHVYAGGLNFMK